MPVIGKKDPGGQLEWMHSARSVEGERQQMEIGVSELGALFQKAHGDEEISVGKKRTIPQRGMTRR